MTNQEIFDLASVGMLKQDESALNDERECVYCEPDRGLRCAVGFVLEGKFEDQFLANLEGAVSTACDAHPAVRAALMEGVAQGQQGVRFSLLRALQGAHDDLNPDEWNVQLRSVAAEHDLNTDAMDKYLASEAT